MQDEKNQVLMTNAWLQLVSDHPEVIPWIYSKFELQMWACFSS